ncbi:MAG: hypothetical protein J6B97_09990, partial [Bacteroidales bacterium]|nr:hypothetical protein [Bacteroidales bacterium]
MSVHGFSVRGSPAVRGPMPDYLECVRVRSRKRMVCVATMWHVVGVIAPVIRTFGLAVRPSVGDKRHA